MKGATGPADGLMGSISEMIDPVEALGAVALATAAAVSALIIGGAKMALDASEFKASAEMTFKALLGSQEAAAATYGQIDQIAMSIGKTQQEIAGKANILLNSGVKAGKQLEETLKASYNLAAVDPAGAAKLEGIIKKSSAAGSFQITAKSLAGTGVSFDDLAKKMGVSTAKLKAQIKAGTLDTAKGLDALNDTINAKLGGLAHDKAMGTLDGQFGILKATATSIFSEVDTKPFVEGLGKITGLLDQSTGSGKAIKAALVGTFNALFSTVSKVLPYIKQFFERIIIDALKLYIHMKPVVAHFQKLFASSKDGKALETTVNLIADAIMWSVEQVVYLAAAIGYLVELGVGTWQALGDGVDYVEGKFQGFTDFVDGIFVGSESLGADFVQGIIDGITNGADAVMNAAKGIANKAMDAVKDTLGIASPSKEMAKLGGHTAAGMAQGLDAGAPMVAQSMGEMVAPPMAIGVAPGAPGASGGPSGSGGGGGVVIESLSVTVTGGKGTPDEIKDAVVTGITLALEELALSGGGG